MPDYYHRKPRSEWTEEQIQHDRFYQKTHYSTIQGRVKKEEAELFKQYAKAHGMTVNGLVVAFVRRCIKQMEQKGELNHAGRNKEAEE